MHTPGQCCQFYGTELKTPKKVLNHSTSIPGSQNYSIVFFRQARSTNINFFKNSNISAKSLIHIRKNVHGWISFMKKWRVWKFLGYFSLPSFPTILGGKRFTVNCFGQFHTGPCFVPRDSKLYFRCRQFSTVFRPCWQFNVDSSKYSFVSGSKK